MLDFFFFLVCRRNRAGKNDESRRRSDEKVDSDNRMQVEDHVRASERPDEWEEGEIDGSRKSGHDDERLRRGDATARSAGERDRSSRRRSPSPSQMRIRANQNALSNNRNDRSRESSAPRDIFASVARPDGVFSREKNSDGRIISLSPPMRNNSHRTNDSPISNGKLIRSGREKVWRSRIVLVSNLDDHVSSNDIFEVFYECGRILHAIQWLYSKGRRFKGKGFVTFLEYESAAKALALSGVPVRGRRMVVEMEKYTAQRTRLVYVSNLPKQSREHERTLRALFEPLGTIKSLNWVYDERVFCGDFIGYVLIEFYREVSAADCDQLVDELVGGCNIQLSYYWLSNVNPTR